MTLAAAFLLLALAACGAAGSVPETLEAGPDATASAFVPVPDDAPAFTGAGGDMNPPSLEQLTGPHGPRPQ